MAENIDLKLENPLSEPSDIFAQTKVEPLTIPAKIPRTTTTASKSKMFMIIAIVLIIIAIVLCCCSLASYYYAQSGKCKKADTPANEKDKCNMVGLPSSSSSCICSILMIVGIGMGIYGLVKK
jgi:hypothetical protein